MRQWPPSSPACSPPRPRSGKRKRCCAFPRPRCPRTGTSRCSTFSGTSSTRRRRAASTCRCITRGLFFAMARGNLEMALLSMQDIARQMPEYSIFTAGYLIRDPDHLAKVYGGPIGGEVSRRVAEVTGIQMLQAVYLGTRQLSLAQPRTVRTPADLAGVKLRMPGSKEWLFLG